MVDVLLLVIINYTSSWLMFYSKWSLIIPLFGWCLTLSYSYYTAYWLMSYSKWFLLYCLLIDILLWLIHNIRLRDNFLTLSNFFIYAFVIDVLHLVIINYTSSWLMPYAKWFLTIPLFGWSLTLSDFYYTA